jgi:hypothetical protein
MLREDLSSLGGLFYRAPIAFDCYVEPTTSGMKSQTYHFDKDYVAAASDLRTDPRIMGSGEVYIGASRLEPDHCLGELDKQRGGSLSVLWADVYIMELLHSTQKLYQDLIAVCAPKAGQPNG